MSKIAKGLIKHTVVVVVGKRERAIATETLLKKMGCNVIVALSLYDALKYVVQEMPHLVVTESELPDGSAASLYDRLQAHAVLKNTPIVVNVLRKTREILQELSKRKFAGFFLGKFDPKLFLRKCVEVLMNPNRPSPYYNSLDSLNMDGKFNLAFSGKVIGKTSDHLVINSGMEVDPSASLVCVPQDKKYPPLLVRQGSNLQEEEDIMNLFPLGKLTGKGRSWLSILPDFKTGVESVERRQVLFYDPDGDRFEQFEEILAGYDIDTVYASSLQRAAGFLKQRHDQFGAIYLHELMADASSIEWNKIYDSIPEKNRPPLIIGTKSMTAKDTPKIKYLRKPYGLGQFVELLTSCFERAGEIKDLSSQAGFVGLDVSFQAPAKLLGLDEMGGVIQVRFPVVEGAKINVPHEMVAKICPDDSEVRVVNVSKVPDTVDLWQIRFSMVGAGTSKSKHFESVSKVVEHYKSENEPEEPTDEITLNAS